MEGKSKVTWINMKSGRKSSKGLLMESEESEKIHNGDCAVTRKGHKLGVVIVIRERRYGFEKIRIKVVVVVCQKFGHSILVGDRILGEPVP